MATIYKTVRQRILDRMDGGAEGRRKWLDGATYVKTDNGYWLAWRTDEPHLAAILRDDAGKTAPATWVEDWEGGDRTLDAWIKYVESGAYERDPPGVLNLFIEDADGKPR